MIQTLLSFIGETGWTVRAIAKLGGLFLGGLIALAIIVAVVGGVFRVAVMGGGMGGGVMPQMMGSSYGDDGYGFAESMDMAYSEPMMGRAAGKMMNAVTSIMPMPPMPSVNGSRNAEKFERTDYSAQFTTRRFAETCDAVEALKPREDVLFDSANRSEHSCWYQFRVEADRADEVLAVIKDLRPNELSSNVQTVAQSIEDTTDRIASLKRQRATVAETLTEAERAYDEAIRAVRGGAIGSLGSLVTEKLATVERLTNTMLSLDEQIRAYEEGKTAQLDDTAYTHFSVNVSRIVIVDRESLMASWRMALQEAVREMSDILAAILLTIPVLVLRALWFIIMALVAIAALALFARAGWTIAHSIWYWRRS